jgi:hypothetical protein
MRDVEQALRIVVLALLCILIALLIAAEFEDDPASRPGYLPHSQDTW